MKATRAPHGLKIMTRDTVKRWPHLPNSPISEALIDIRAELPADVDLDTLAGFHDGISDRYPNRRERVSWTAQFELSPGAPPRLEAPSGGPDGYLFTSPEGNQIVQARLDGFTFSRLKRYENWQSLRDEARSLWEHDQLESLESRSATSTDWNYHSPWTTSVTGFLPHLRWHQAYRKH